ncbi:hypothetical protein [Stakelama pacifica]|uniref:Uncharacterized protein n=1 Tax=Stakelama pacifica TaxID=517720 RepID=A0A4V3BT27_9SPHN|nr:hypothetical protein [Stakelama pacifica]TDN81798.1 hypothetical protein EV664_107200 [Stakelama pacifica]GGO96600.1 hypothetical protein GCM10011329_23510 [Stakelama pacifica]
MALVLSLLVGLLAMCIASVLKHRRARTAAAFALLLNWGMNTAAVKVAGNDFPVPIWMITDYLAGLFIFCFWWGAERRSNWNVAIIATYAAMLVCHGGFLQSDGGAWARYHYWWTLYYLAWSQVFITGGWIVADGIADRRRARRGLASAASLHRTPL